MAIGVFMYSYIQECNDGWTTSHSKFEIEGVILINVIKKLVQKCNVAIP